MGDHPPTADRAADLASADPCRLVRVWPSAVTPAVGTPAEAPGADVGAWQPDELADVLRHQLSAPLDPPAASETGPRTYAELLLTDADPPTELLVRVKDWAKPMMGTSPCDPMSAEADLPTAVAGVVYFATIYAALVRKGERITQLPDATVRQGGRWALAQPWLDDRLVPLFRAGLATPRANPTPG